MTSPRLVLVAAVAENGVIGAENALPWRLPTDLRHFKALTMGRPIVMGRRTYQAIGRALPGRANIVVTRDPGFAAEGVEVAGGLDVALARARSLAAAQGFDEVCVIGGADIYAQTIAGASRLEITTVHASPPGDAFFPGIDPSIWRETRREGPTQGPEDSAAMTFLTYQRRSE